MILRQVRTQHNSNLSSRKNKTLRTRESDLALEGIAVAVNDGVGRHNAVLLFGRVNLHNLELHWTKAGAHNEVITCRIFSKMIAVENKRRETEPLRTGR